jgi:hypothetical protein
LDLKGGAPSLNIHRNHTTAKTNRRIAVSADRQDLRARLARRQREKAELERRLHAAQRRYEDEVAPLEEEVLRVRMEQLRRAAQRHMRSAKHRNAYHDAQREYEAFRDERASPPAAAPDDLRALYRRASKRCHPDVVPAAYREQAAATFQALDAAYQAGHAPAVRAIATALERWGFPDASRDPGPDGPRSPDELREAVAALEAAVRALRETDVYRAVAGADSLDALLHAKKEALLRRLRALQPE